MSSSSLILNSAAASVAAINAIAKSLPMRCFHCSHCLAAYYCWLTGSAAAAPGPAGKKIASERSLA